VAEPRLPAFQIYSSKRFGWRHRRIATTATQPASGRRGFIGQSAVSRIEHVADAIADAIDCPLL
jgi:hypothetical protein